MKKLSEQFLEMSQRTAAVENRAAATRQGNQAEFAQHVADAKAKVQKAQTAFTTKLDSIEDSLSSDWHELNASVENQINAARQRTEKRLNAADLANARRQADDAEAYADIAAEFAQLAAEVAQEAMLEAKQARARAESLGRTLG